ncbi:MAG: hypothetical protein GC159_20105 [Phycisphaera sp.]|nr:hypothetical protein [Phycisphaera sp.]
MSTSVDQVRRELTEHDVLSEEELRAARGRLAPDGANDVEAFTRELVRAGKLTGFQAKAALNGQTKVLRFDDPDDGDMNLTTTGGVMGPRRTCRPSRPRTPSTPTTAPTSTRWAARCTAC